MSLAMHLSQSQKIRETEEAAERREKYKSKDSTEHVA
jgi:hypothetical protein